MSFPPGGLSLVPFWHAEMTVQTESFILRSQLLSVETAAMRVDSPAGDCRVTLQTVLLSMARCAGLQPLAGGLTVAKPESDRFVVKARGRPERSAGAAEISVTIPAKGFRIVAGGALRL